MKLQVVSVLASGIVVLLLLLGGCVKQEWLVKPPEQGGNKTVANVSSPQLSLPESMVENESSLPEVPQKVDQEMEAPLDEGDQTDVESIPEVPVSQDRIDVSVRSNGADVTAKMGGGSRSFTVPDTDHDAVVFEIAQELGRGIKEVRPLVYIDGKPYLKPSELKKAQSQLAQEEASRFNTSTIPILARKGEGFIWGVGCDLDHKYLRVELTNPTEKSVSLFQDVYPRIKDALIISLNRRMLMGITCGDVKVLQPRMNASCIQAEAVFISGGSRNAFETNASYDASNPDMVGATRPGYKESMPFFCRSSNETSFSNETP